MTERTCVSFRTLGIESTKDVFVSAHITPFARVRAVHLTQIVHDDDDEKF